MIFMESRLGANQAPHMKRRRRRDFSRRLHCGSALISRILCPRCPSTPGCDHLSVRLIAQPAPAYAVERLLPGGIHPLRDLRPGWPFSCSVLHRMRFVVPPSSRLGRWALTPPFHPYPRLRAGGLFSVILSVTAACTAAPTLSRGMLPCGVRTFLWSPALQQNPSDHSDRPAVRVRAPGKRASRGCGEKLYSKGSFLPCCMCRKCVTLWGKLNGCPSSHED